MDKKYHLERQPIPAGFRIYEDRLEVMGAALHKAAALPFCRGKCQAIILEPEPGNRHDPNAIQIIGQWKGWLLNHRKKIGYVPREAAKRLADAHMATLVAGRLLKTYAGRDGFVEILFQIVGPVEAYDQYAQHSPNPRVRTKAKLNAGDVSGAIAELIAKVEAAESEARAQGYGVAPAPYLDLAKIYRKSKRRDDEIEILERYERQKKAPGRLPAELAARLAKLKAPAK